MTSRKYSSSLDEPPLKESHDFTEGNITCERADEEVLRRHVIVSRRCDVTAVGAFVVRHDESRVSRYNAVEIRAARSRGKISS